MDILSLFENGTIGKEGINKLKSFQEDYKKLNESFAYSVETYRNFFSNHDQDKIIYFKNEEELNNSYLEIIEKLKEENSQLKNKNEDCWNTIDEHQKKERKIKNFCKNNFFVKRKILKFLERE